MGDVTSLEGDLIHKHVHVPYQELIVDVQFIALLHQIDSELPMNERQSGWKVTLSLMLMLQPRQRCRPPEHPLRRWCCTVVSHRSFDWLIFLVILGSICTLMLPSRVYIVSVILCVYKFANVLRVFDLDVL